VRFCLGFVIGFIGSIGLVYTLLVLLNYLLFLR
jgi:hypothetical protein